MPRAAAAKDWVFTWNNPTKTPEEVMEDFSALKVIYLVFQEEKGESGTKHYQGTEGVSIHHN